MKNAIKKHYEDYWSKTEESFSAYDRNKYLSQFFHAGEKVLDVGCGDGTVGQYLSEKLGLEVWGIDISSIAVGRALKKGVKAKVASSEEKFPFKDQMFDVVFWGDNIEHLFDPMVTAKEIKRVLKRNGRLIVSCPNMSYWRYRLYFFLNGELPDTEWTGLPKWNWSHIRFFNLRLLDLFFKEAGFRKVNRVVGVSTRRLDRPLLKLGPALFGMILIAEVI